MGVLITQIQYDGPYAGWRDDADLTLNIKTERMLFRPAVPQLTGRLLPGMVRMATPLSHFLMILMPSWLQRIFQAKGL
jgi:hypothetical protein